MTRTPPSVSNFGPEIMHALIEGSKRRLEIPLSWRKCVAFRQRVNQLRAAMRAENHQFVRVVALTKVTIEWPPDTATKRAPNGVRFPTNAETICKLIIAPADQDFALALAKVGLEVPKLDAPPVNTGPVADDADTESVEDMLQRLAAREETT